jgi:H+/gluconate symporter-like permease
MRILFYYFLPALIPILLYVISFYIESYRAKKHNLPAPQFFSSKFLNAFMISLVIAILTFILLFAVMQNRTIENYNNKQKTSQIENWRANC